MSTVLVTGSSRGIGLAIASNFASRGHNVVLNCKTSSDELEEALSSTKKTNGNTIAVMADVSQYANAELLFEEITSTFGGVDILINNAGIDLVKLFSDCKKDDWERIISNNLNSAINCSNLAIKSMINNKAGTIINISSIWGEVGASMEVLYSTSKGALDSFTKALAKEVAPSGICVNAVSLGVIDTNMNNWLTDEERLALIERIPSGRFGAPGEVADLVYYLCVGAPRYLTGQIIRLDGGFI